MERAKEQEAKRTKADEKIHNEDIDEEGKPKPKKVRQKTVIRTIPNPKIDRVKDGEERPANFFLRHNWSDLKQNKKLISKQHLKKKYNQLMAKKRQFFKERDQTMDNYGGETNIKPKDKK